MIDIFFDYFGYDKEHYFVAGIAYECVIIPNLTPRIITINKNNIIVLRGLLLLYLEMMVFWVKSLLGLGISARPVVPVTSPRFPCGPVVLVFPIWASLTSTSD